VRFEHDSTNSSSKKQATNCRYGWALHFVLNFSTRMGSCRYALDVQPGASIRYLTVMRLARRLRALVGNGAAVARISQRVRDDEGIGPERTDLILGQV
jgi:hypothetical protein